ncbi:oxygen-dependent tRNA uridine(34) hydroxylase TrhO [Sphingomonas sp. Mn802worker]|uniref:oxygen-dependent tRNA uridine(34) hydroxylase TrhO n=1 Tax=Sphingomonas sp. Mn802worker TaxID=629773 RepID=UPI0003809683|nr:rhodanese-related sulfurtransferase [Sphingomonas sp. Mn802worker]
MTETSLQPPILVAALYQFTRFDDVAAIKATLLPVCEVAGVRGSLLLADEGLNGTIAGSDEGIAAVLAHLRALPGCAGLEVKFSRAGVMPFGRMKVRLKREIVTMGQPDLDPVGGVGAYVEPADWNALIDDPDTVLIDTRNDYEVALGSFVGAIDPGTRSFRDFPAWFRAQREALIEKGRTPKIAMFCTGGIRCEKATAFVRSEGLEDVFHLKGGILNYLEQVPEAETRWHGECFVFDERVSVTHDLSPTHRAMCKACQRPVGADGCSCGDMV